VWSTRPTHEPLTTRALFDAGTPIGRSNRGSRPGSAANRHPATKRTYRLRSYVVCELCGRRMYGKTRRVGTGYSYYACEVQPAHHAHRDCYATHPKNLWISEDKLLTAVNRFFATRIFGPHRQALLGQADPTAPKTDDTARQQSFRIKINELERQQANLVAELQADQSTGDDDTDQQWRAQLRAGFADLAHQRKLAQADLDALTGHTCQPGPGDPALLDLVPALEADVVRLPEHVQRELFDRFQLQIRFHHPTRRTTLRVTISGDTIHHLTHTPVKTDRKRADRQPTDNKTPPPSATAGREGFSLALRAPDRIRTCANGSGG
jgi:site-specific DNA recombinase